MTMAGPGDSGEGQTEASLSVGTSYEKPTTPPPGSPAHG